MEKLNDHRQKLEALIDELTTLVGNVRYAHAAVSHLQKVSEKPTEDQLRFLHGFGFRYTTLLSRKDAESMIQEHSFRTLFSLLERGINSLPYVFYEGLGLVQLRYGQTHKRH